ncbi:MAG: DUF1963 domain-containing protein [Candidatus Paracaedibacteraceae bacterium]|nr:DUF1963 domain-containing protein [Candidatus Paracaedibacteraceae bacterium]
MDKLKVLKDIYATRQECIGINATPINDLSRPLECWESKFGGLPYLSKEFPYPKNNKGEPLHLLAQINFMDMPRLDHFPLDGILQFYIDADDVYGMDLDGENSSGFKVIYIPYYTEDNFHYDKDYSNKSDLSFLKTPEYFPIDCEHKISFFRTFKPISCSNPDFSSCFAEYINQDELEPDFYELYSSLINDSNIHQIGGYPSFTQEGPSYLKERKDLILLLQIGHDQKISFGDAGIATFFIERKDLINLNFSNVLYYWDCY